MKNGVPWDVAWSLEDTEVLAYCVTFGRFEGNEFDWQQMKWVERKSEG